MASSAESPIVGGKGWKKPSDGGGGGGGGGGSKGRGFMPGLGAAVRCAQAASRKGPGGLGSAAQQQLTPPEGDIWELGEEEITARRTVRAI